MDAANLSIRFQELDRKRKRIESEVAEFTEILKSNQNVGMHGPLIDADGFPRSDIDLVAVRTARNRIICLNTDHAAVMRELEAVSSRLLDSKQPVPSAPVPMDTSNGSPSVAAAASRATASSEPAFNSTPFLLIDQVSPGSAAELAGIQVNDQLTRFGSVISDNFVDLGSIASVVKLTDAKSGIPITVLRLSEGQQTFHQLTLFKPPASGSLGLHIVPLRK